MREAGPRRGGCVRVGYHYLPAMNARGGAPRPKYVAKPAFRDRAGNSGAQWRLAGRRRQEERFGPVDRGSGHGTEGADHMGIKEHNRSRGTDEAHRGARHGVRRTLAGWVTHNRRSGAHRIADRDRRRANVTRTH